MIFLFSVQLCLEIGERHDIIYYFQAAFFIFLFFLHCNAGLV